MKARETEMIALGEEEATRPATRPRESCSVSRCEYRNADGLCAYYEMTGSVRPCVAGEGCHFAGGNGKQANRYRKSTDDGPDVRQVLYDQGLTDKEIAERSGYNINTIIWWWNKNGLPPNGTGEKQLSESPEKQKPPAEKPKKPEEKQKKPEEKQKKPEEKPKKPAEEQKLPVEKQKPPAEQAPGRHFRVMLEDGTEVRTRGIGIAASMQTVGVLDGDDMVAWFPVETVRGIYAEA